MSQPATHARDGGLPDEGPRPETDGSLRPSRGTPTPVFLFSLPRSGSTLAQRIIGSHEDVATASEPWVLLPFFYALRDRGLYAEYNHTSAVTALEDFCEKLPNGRQDYVAEVRELALRLYAKAAPDGARYFLDKTPRYHLISGDVISAFPEAKHLFLWRNPLAVAASIIETWGGGKWNLYRHKIDLFDGLENLVNAYEANRSNALAIRFEDLVVEPEETWGRVFRHLDLPFDPSILASFSSVELNGRKGDPTGTRRYATVSREPLDRWKTTLASPVRKAWCRRYLRWIGRERLKTMGYDLDDLMRELAAIRAPVRGIVSDAGRACYGLVYAAGEPKILRHKLGTMPDWRRVHVHK